MDRTRSGFAAVAALEMKSILHGSLCWDVHEPDGETEAHGAGRQREMRKQREGFLQAVSTWPSNVSLELRISAFPSISCTPNGLLAIHFLICATGSKKAEVMESAATHYLNLMPIMRSHMPEAEFVPVQDEDVLKRILRPFEPGFACTIKRVEQIFALSEPFSRLSIGFEKLSKVVPEVAPQSVRHLFPWLPSGDDWGIFLTTMMGKMEPGLFLARLSAHKASPETLASLRGTIEACEVFLKTDTGQNGILNRQTQMIRDVAIRRLAELQVCCFHLETYMVEEKRPDKVFASIVGRSISRYDTGDNANYFEGGFSVTQTDPGQVFSPRECDDSEDYALSEAACAFRLPDPPRLEIPGLPIRRSRTALAVFPRLRKAQATGLNLFTNSHAGLLQPVALTETDRFRHCFILGQTGTGKSTLMEHMVLQDIHGGEGVAVLDPHGDMVEQLLGKIPKDREKDVIYFNMLDRERPLGINVIEWHTPEEQARVIDELYLTLDRVYSMKDTGGPMFENNFRGMLKLLMGARKEGEYVPTLLEFTLCYQNRRFRKWLKKRATDPQVHDFIKELEETGGEANIDNLSPYITSKFTRFVQDTTLRVIIGQEKSAIDFDEVMNHRKILLVNLGKGRFGPNVSALLANHLVTRFKQAAMKRGEVPIEKRVPFHMYIDEAHNLPSEGFAELLSEARKYRLSLTLATQYAAQIRDESRRLDLLSAVLGNVGTIILFRLGYEDAKSIAQVLYPTFNAHDIIGLPNYEGYAKMQFNGETVLPFSFRTRPNPECYSQGTAERVRKTSRERYGRDVKEVEERIMERRTFWDEEAKQL